MISKDEMVYISSIDVFLISIYLIYKIKRTSCLQKFT